ncbi:hypothetical protein Vretifemale_19097 [Volvox reticuliferus]|uniref:Uncharacterized protein n=1 Tax=Volvox reticuliferus TaxID=1737510 RepID=A0A8J4FY82_9CHLO|nr:hypothetical protein Vretifemale_19097 [Volvox reticuliferus]
MAAAAAAVSGNGSAWQQQHVAEAVHSSGTKQQLAAVHGRCTAWQQQCMATALCGSSGSTRQQHRAAAVDMAVAARGNGSARHRQHVAAPTCDSCNTRQQQCSEITFRIILLLLFGDLPEQEMLTLCEQNGKGDVGKIQQIAEAPSLAAKMLNIIYTNCRL